MLLTENQADGKENYLSTHPQLLPAGQHTDHPVPDCQRASSGMDSIPSHRLLQCPELLAEIFSHLELGTSPTDVKSSRTSEINDEHRKLRKTLAAAALSCRALTAHALVVLWRQLDSVQPLLSLLSKRKRQFPKSNITVS
ncbi:hypothetical protein GSI_04895 [Ganoderma sinense ZZ0214-1]|uniref:Uncharacterized protein n=1 Tax=Ganoderma sinense ZZ0214-1 TaxID=1077348 RepID=A0A2G8SGT6_9APHY|nr:hypothetical protein GSI_04895 [Ganoderma sinense ZZ0214-1]